MKGQDQEEGGRYASALATTLEASAVPFGYTVTIWSSGALLTHFHGSPGPLDVAGFIAGALLAFAGLGLAAHSVVRMDSPPPSRRSRVLAGSMDVVAVGLAVGAVTLLVAIPGPLAWALGSLTATVVFLVSASVQLAVAVRIRG